MRPLSSPLLNTTTSLQEATRKLERELSEAQVEAGRASKKASETAEHLRVSKEEAERARGQGKRSTDDLQRQVCRGDNNLEGIAS